MKPDSTQKPKLTFLQFGLGFASLACLYFISIMLLMVLDKLFDWIVTTVLGLGIDLPNGTYAVGILTVLAGWLTIKYVFEGKFEAVISGASASMCATVVCLSIVGLSDNEPLSLVLMLASGIAVGIFTAAWVSVFLKPLPLDPEWFPAWGDEDSPIEE